MNKIIIILFICLSNLTNAQYGINHKNSYTAWLNFTNGKTIKGTILYVNDSSIIASNSSFDQYKPMGFMIDEYSFKHIDLIEIRHDENPIIGGIVGAIIGFTIGWGIKWVNEYQGEGNIIQIGRNFIPILSPFVWGAAAIPVGVQIGIVMGSIKTKIPIKGKHKNYKDNIEKLQKYSAN